MINIAVLASHNGSGLDTLYNAYIDKTLDINIKVLISNNTTSPSLQKATNYGIDNYIVNSKTDMNVDEKIYTLLQQ